MGGEAAAERARALVGTAFRLQGRSRAEGLDCIGVAAAAFGIEEVTSGYSLRGTQLARLEEELAARGFHRGGSGAARSGDLMIFAPGPAQLHLAVCTGTAFVHADMGLGRVVERPLPAPWPLIARWRAQAAPLQGD